MKKYTPIIVASVIFSLFAIPLFKDGLAKYYDGLKDFSFPFALAFFGISILYYKFAIIQYRHYENMPEPKTDSDDDIIKLEILKQKDIISQGQVELKKAEAAYESIEIGALITGVIAGVLGILAYFS